MPGFVVQGVGRSTDASNIKPYYSYTWEVGEIFGALHNARDAVQLCVNITMPKFSVKPEEVDGGSIVYKYAGSVRWENVNVTWYDTHHIAPYIKMWRERIWNNFIGLGVADEYKHNSVVTVLTYDLALYKKWTLVGSWPSEISEGELTYTDSDIKQISVSLAYDYGIDELSDESASAFFDRR